MSVEQWEFGIRPEILETRVVKIDGKRFLLADVVEALEALEESDFLNPVFIFDEDLVEALKVEGLAYAQGNGYVGTEMVPAALEKIRPLLTANLAKWVNTQLKEGYICSIAFDHELGQTTTDVFATPEDLRDNDCGLNKGKHACTPLKVLVYAVEVVEFENEDD